MAKRKQTLTERVKTLEFRQSRLAQIVKSYGEIHDEHDAKLSEHSGKIQKLQGEFDAMARGSQKEWENLRDEIDNLDLTSGDGKRIEGLNELVGELRGRILELEADNRKLQFQNSGMSGPLEEAKRDLAATLETLRRERAAKPWWKRWPWYR